MKNLISKALDLWNSNRKWELILLLFAAAYILFILFSHIETLTIRKWDEARNAINALEMYQKGFSIVTTCHYYPDHWNTKPPLLIWLQVFFIKLFGINEIAVRLPSALSGIALFLYLLWQRKTVGFTIGQIAIWALIVFSLPIIIQSHCYKTGDYDALLTFFMVGYIVYYYKYLIEENQKAIYYFFLFLFLASLTKGIAGLLFLPGLFLFTLVSNKLYQVLKTPKLYILLFSTAACILSYYFLREQYDEGYINAVIENELGGRFLREKEDHGQNWDFYFTYLFNNGLGYYIVLLPFLLILLLSKLNKTSFSSLAFIIFLSHIIILSFSQTRLYWYILPSIPLLAFLFTKTLSIVLQKNYRLMFLFVLFPLIMQVSEVTTVQNLEVEASQVANSIFLRDYKCDYDSLFIIEKDYIEHTRFYEQKILEEQDCYVDIRKLKYMKEDHIILFSEESKDNVESVLEYEKIRQENKYTLAKVTRLIEK